MIQPPTTMSEDDYYDWLADLMEQWKDATQDAVSRSVEGTLVTMRYRVRVGDEMIQLKPPEPCELPHEPNTSEMEEHAHAP